ncbi:MAG TPA: serine/threonine-protein kinase, partial [Bryobacteraceae bacterium]|nr:serine/threonine-protein kinase [Bryobacteraceae bacterium]
MLRRTISHYDVLEKLGAGGMGEVYRAHDSKLRRDVAIKVLPAGLAHDSEYIARFRREAQVLASLKHPNIAVVYGLEDDAIVMELIEGETLATRIKKGRLPIELVVRYGIDIAAALAAAHSSGIVHRDLKPGNVMVTKANVKVLDFGLAKQTQADETLTVSRALMGTPAYMAPEQLEGVGCDARSDIYALGLILYEMATGKQRNQGETTTPSDLSERFAHVLDRCLEREPENRWQSSRDLQMELEWAAKNLFPSTAKVVRRGQRWTWAVATAIALAVVGIVLLLYLSQPQSQPSARLDLSFRGLSNISLPSPSPDGSRFLFAARNASGKHSLWVRPLNSDDAQPLPGTEDAV